MFYSGSRRPLFCFRKSESWLYAVRGGAKVSKQRPYLGSDNETEDTILADKCILKYPLNYKLSLSEINQD